MEKSVRILISLFFVLIFTALQFPSLAASADLIAGRNTDVGDVLVWQEGVYLYVQYLIADPTEWCMTMTHLAVGASLDDIPQTHRGNPIPDRFPYKGIFENGCGAEFTYKINIATYKSGTTLFIAAHAYVRHQETHENEHVWHHVRHQETHGNEHVRHHVRHQETHEIKSAWSAGSYFRYGNGATYFTFTVQEIPR